MLSGVIGYMLEESTGDVWAERYGCVHLMYRIVLFIESNDSLKCMFYDN